MIPASAALLVCGCLHLAMVSSLEINMAVILPFDNARPFSVQKIRPAIEIARRRLERDQVPSESTTIVFHYEDSRCDIAHGLNKAIKLHIDHGMDVFLGPVCDFAVSPVARQCTFWNLPIISGGAMASGFTSMRKSMFFTLTRIGPANLHSLSNLLYLILIRFKWKRLKLLYEREGQSQYVERLCYLAPKTVFMSLQAKGTSVQLDYYRLNDNQDYAEMFSREISTYSVMVLCASPDTVREIMIKAHELNFDNGEYVFLDIDLFSSKDTLDRPWYRANDTDDRNEKARKAYEALMTITIRKPTSPEFTQFSEEVKRTASELYPNVSYGDGQVNSFVGAFYDAVILYGLALNETLAANGNVSDGSAITHRMWNRTFEGITGSVYIDDNGDRDSDFSLLDMNPQTGTFEVVANYYGVRRHYEPVPGKSIHWAGGRVNPPPDTPECGFDGSRCRDKETLPTYAIVLLVLGPVMLIVLVTLLFVYRARFRDVLQRWCTGRGRDHMAFRLW